MLAGRVGLAPADTLYAGGTGRDRALVGPRRPVDRWLFKLAGEPTIARLSVIRLGAACAKGGAFPVVSAGSSPGLMSATLRKYV